jgi:hypothetical protein
LRLFAPALEGSPEAVRQSIYAGDVYLFPATPDSLRLAESVRDRVEQAFSDLGPARQAQHRISGDEFFARVGELRRAFYTDPEYHHSLRRLLGHYGFDPASIAFDPIRLRAIMHRGHENPKAAPVYYPHRDTWYANPQAQMTWWIPLDDLDEEETFVFMPDYFTTPVSNNSECFDYSRWTEGGTDLRIGWQDPEAGQKALYPGQTDSQFGETRGFRVRFGQVLLFSGHHLHQTLPQATGRTRFSIDCRTVHLGDFRTGRGAPNVDNRSTGSAVTDWVLPAVPTDHLVQG